MKLALCLFALAFAQDADAGYGSAETAGYEEAPTTAYAAPVAYAKRAPSICYTGQCSRDAPCYNFATGTCSPKAGSASYDTASYAAPASYSGEEATPDYRKLQDFQGSMRFGCPAGTQDTKDWSMHKQTVLWIGFGFLFAPALCFLWMSFQKNEHKDVDEHLSKESITVRINAGIVNMVASLAYLTMATKHGFVTRCNGRDFYYARYVDWIITTPLMLYDLAVIGGSDTNTKLFICAIDIFMIVSGLIGSLVEDSGAGFGGTSEKWAFFGFSMLAFVPVIWYLCAMSGAYKDDEKKFKSFGQLCDVSINMCNSSGSNDREKVYTRAANLTVITWICYPIIWICAEGTETISVEGENIAYTVLDILAKSLFGWIIVFSPWWLKKEKNDCQLVLGSSML